MMLSDLKKAIKKIDTEDWKKVSVEFGRNALEILVPPDCVELTMKEVTVLPDPQKAIEQAFLDPISSPPLEEIIRKKGKLPERCLWRLLFPISQGPSLIKVKVASFPHCLDAWSLQGLRKKISRLVATGMHRASTPDEKVEMYGKEVVEQYTILDYDCENNDLLGEYWKDEKGDSRICESGLLFCGPEDRDRTCRESFFHWDLRWKKVRLSGVWWM